MDEFKKPKKRKSNLVEVRNKSGQNIKGYNVIYKPGDTFKIDKKAAEMLMTQNRVELVSNATSEPS